MTDEYLLPVRSPRGTDAHLFVRPGTNDTATIHSTFMAPGGVVNDEYGLAGLHLTGWALDVGAHIGSVALALVIDNPELQVVAIEAVPENAALMQRSVEFLNLQDRVHVVSAAATARGHKTAQINYGESGDESQFIGNLVEHSKGREVPAVSLADILDRFGVSEFAFTKTDCEGGEWGFFSDPAANAHLAVVIGEWHARDGHNSITDLFAATHDVTAEGEGFGPFRAIRR